MGHGSLVVVTSRRLREDCHVHPVTATYHPTNSVPLGVITNEDLIFAEWSGTWFLSGCYGVQASTGRLPCISRNSHVPSHNTRKFLRNGVRHNSFNSGCYGVQESTGRLPCTSRNSHLPSHNCHIVPITTKRKPRPTWVIHVAKITLRGFYGAALRESLTVA